VSYIASTRTHVSGGFTNSSGHKKIEVLENSVKMQELYTHAATWIIIVPR